MKQMDYTEYIMIYTKSRYTKFVIESHFKTLPLDNDLIVAFIPKKMYPCFRTECDINCYQLKVDWLIMKPILKRLITKDEWVCKFENDVNWDDLEEIKEEINDPISRLYATEKYFGTEDPIIHTRLLIDPWKDNDAPIIIYYGETISFQDNTDKNISKVINQIWAEYKNYYNYKLEGVE